MSAGKHTEGPWAVAKSVHCTGFAALQVRTEDGTPIAEIWETLSDYVSAEANAHLIAAAPETAAERDRLRASNEELLAALKVFVAMIEDSMRDMIHPAIGRFVPGVTDLELKPDGSATLCQVRALIAKAEGGS